MSTLLRITIMISALCLSLSAANDFPPSIKVYAESLCPDTINFIVNSFGQFKDFPERSKVLKSIDFIVFGNASEEEGSTEGSRKFKCQHGPKECFGNKIQNCAFKYLATPEFEDFLICFSSKVREVGRDNAQLDVITEQCNREAFKDIHECAHFAEGDELLHVAGQNTGEHNYVPYIIVNDSYNIKYQEPAETNLFKFLCDYSREVGQVLFPGCESEEEFTQLKFLK